MALVLHRTLLRPGIMPDPTEVPQRRKRTGDCQTSCTDSFASSGHRHYLHRRDRRPNPNLGDGITRPGGLGLAGQPVRRPGWAARQHFRDAGRGGTGSPGVHVTVALAAVTDREPVRCRRTRGLGRQSVAGPKPRDRSEPPGRQAGRRAPGRGASPGDQTQPRRTRRPTPFETAAFDDQTQPCAAPSGRGLRWRCCEISRCGWSVWH